MAGTNARHAASTLNTTCLATASQTINAAKITIRSRKNPAPCGSNTRISSPDRGQWGGSPNQDGPYPRQPHDHLCERPRRDIEFPGEHVKRARGPSSAVEVGFEPTEGLPPHTLSRRAPSATRRLHRGRAYPNPDVRAAPRAGHGLLPGSWLREPARGEEVAEHGPAFLRQHPS